MRFLGCLIVLGALATACGGDPDVGGGDGSTSEAGSSSSSGPGTTTTISDSGQTATNATDPGTTTVDPSGTDTSSGSADDSSSSGAEASSSTGCTPGELDCACDAGACADGLECVDDVCGEIAECQDDEYGDITTEDTAYFLGEIDDNDDSGGTVAGVLTGPDDVDWFRYDGTDGFFNNVDPFRTIVASGPVRFCKFASCPGENGIADTNFPCEDGAVATTSPDGRPGCCADTLIHVPGAVCGSSSINDDSMAVWIRVDQSEDVCVSYAFDYHF